MVAANNVDSYPFLAFLDLTCRVDDTEKKMLPDCTASQDSKEKELASRDQETSLAVGTSASVVLVPFRAWECVPIAIPGGADISNVPGCYLLRQTRHQRGL